MRKGMKMMLANQNQRSGGENDRRSGRMDYGGEQMRNGDRFEMRYERGGQDGELRRGEIGYERMNYGGDMRGREMRYDGDMRYDSDMRYGEMEPMSEEMRRGRRRYRDGRFAPENRHYPPPIYDGGDGDMEEMARGYNLDPMNNYPEQRRRGAMESRIGFRMGDDPQTGETLAFPQHHMTHKGKGGRLDKEAAESWVENLENEDGTKGAHWTMEQTEQVRRQKNVDCDPLEFWVAMNATYSDLVKIAKKHNVNTMDYYVDYVKTFWFGDHDAVPHKLAAYYEAVVQK